MAAPDTRESVFRDSPILFTKVGKIKIKCKKQKKTNQTKKPQSPTYTPLPTSAPNFSGLSSHLDWVPLGIPSASKDPQQTPPLNPRPAGSVLARLKYYLAQASERGTPKLPMGPAPAGLHSQEAQTCPNTGRHLAPPPYC